MNRNQILLAIDGSEASERAVRYVGDLLGKADATIRLLNVLPPIPPSIMETPGSTDPDEEAQIESQADVAEQRWTAEKAKEALPTLDRMRRILLDAGVGEGRTKLDHYAPTPEESVPEALLALAADYGCDTIVVGHHSLPWYRELLRKHVGEQLVRHADGRTVWVIG